MNKEEMARKSGESNYRKPKKLILNEIKINGTDGNFVKTLFTKPKDANGKYEDENLKEEVKVVFLKIRRKLTQFEKGRGLVRNTTEHSVPTDTVMMYGDDQQKGVAKDLRDKFPGLRTQQVIYAIDTGSKEIVRLIVKGASLGSENKAEGVMAFYDYLSSFGKDEHTWEYITVLTPAKEKSALGTYYCMSFGRGEKLSDAQLEKVSEAMDEVCAHTDAEDEYNGAKADKATTAPQKGYETFDEKDEDVIEYPSEDIDASQIPF